MFILYAAVPANSELLNLFSCLHESESWLGYSTPPQRLPLGIPVKIAVIEKNRKCAGTMGKGKKPSSTLLSFLFPSCPALSFSFSPASLQHEEASVEERDWVIYQNTLGKKLQKKESNFQHLFQYPKHSKKKAVL